MEFVGQMQLSDSGVGVLGHLRESVCEWCCCLAYTWERVCCCLGVCDRDRAVKSERRGQARSAAEAECRGGPGPRPRQARSLCSPPQQSRKPQRLSSPRTFATSACAHSSSQRASLPVTSPYSHLCPRLRGTGPSTASSTLFARVGNRPPRRLDAAGGGAAATSGELAAFDAWPAPDKKNPKLNFRDFDERFLLIARAKDTWRPDLRATFAMQVSMQAPSKQADATEPRRGAAPSRSHGGTRVWALV